MNNNIRIYNTSRDVSIVAHVSRNHSKTPFVVKDIKIFDAFDTINGCIIEPSEMQLIQITDVFTSKDSHSTFKSENIGCADVFNIFTYTNLGGARSAVGETIRIGETINQLRLLISVPATVIDACVGQNDKVFTIVAELGHDGLQHDNIVIEPNVESGELTRRKNASLALGRIIIDGFGEVSFTWVHN